MDFTKMQGAGNDYIYLNCTETFPDDPAQLAVILSDRHFGIGSDGLILICTSECADFGMRIFNADGTEAEMCGNGIRCAAKYVLDQGLTKKHSLTFETKAGLRTVELHMNGEDVETATVDMGDAIVGKRMTIYVKGKPYTGIEVSVGNPHFVISVPDVDGFDLNEIGPELERNPVFDSGVNVEIVKVLCKGKILMRVWERGSGETLACGTGACAATAALIAMGEIGDQTTVCLKGGTLEVFRKAPGNHIFLSGPAVTVFEGKF